MSRTDPIADAFTMIRNATAVKKPAVNIPSSKLLEKILEILKRDGFIENFKKVEDSKQGILRVHLKFDKEGKPAISGLKRISKSSLRVYVAKDEIPYVLRGLGTAIITTSKGIFTDKEARKMKIGGEVICYIW